MELSRVEARRIGLAAQGFSITRPARPTIRDVRKAASQFMAMQLDSVNVLVRSHYLTLYSRLGPYPMEAVDRLAYDRRELFEYWGHATCLLPMPLYPLFRHRMIRVHDFVQWPDGRAQSADPQIVAVYDEVAEHGPLAANELSMAGRRKSNWWGWDSSKITLETLLDSGHLAIAGRRGFTRLYDITERVIRREALDAPVPGAEEAQKELLLWSARALGVGTARRTAGYFGIHGRSKRTQVKGPDGKWPKPLWPRLLAELVEDQQLVQVEVEGWDEPGYMLPRTRKPRPLHHRALLTPFDSFIRGSAESLCRFTNPLAQQLYVPAERRQYGYYVLPFLLGDTLVGRCDLKADRERSTLLVLAAHVEPGQDAGHVAAELAAELRQLADWLELETITIAARGNLARELRLLIVAGTDDFSVRPRSVQS